MYVGAMNNVIDITKQANAARKKREIEQTLINPQGTLSSTEAFQVLTQNKTATHPVEARNVLNHINRSVSASSTTIVFREREEDLKSTKSNSQVQEDSK